MQTNTTSTQLKKLLDQVRDRIRFKHYSLSTEKTNVVWSKPLILYHQKRHLLEIVALEEADNSERSSLSGGLNDRVRKRYKFCRCLANF